MLNSAAVAPLTSDMERMVQTGAASACVPTMCGENVGVSRPGSHQTSAAFAHRLPRVAGRDPHEPQRAATPLKLLLALTFVIAFGVAASEFAHMLATGHISAGLAGFAFATFAV